MESCILLPTAENIALAVRTLTDGGLVAVPTETVYGLAADATNPKAVEKIFLLKGRPSINPLIVHVGSRVKALSLADLLRNPKAKIRFETLLDSTLMPGPLSCVVPQASHIAPAVCAGLQSVCIRYPNHPVMLEILQRSNLALAAPSANRSTEVSPSSALHVLKSFRDDSPLIIDGGECSVGIESTVVDLTSEIVTILRPGAVTYQALELVLGEPVLSSVPQEKVRDIDSSLPSPGMLLTHYQPKTPLHWLTDYIPSMDRRVGVVLFRDTLSFPAGDEIRYASRRGDPVEIAHNLYSLLHELDECNLQALYIDRCDTEGLGAAIMDRLNRAVHKS